MGLPAAAGLPSTLGGPGVRAKGRSPGVRGLEQENRPVSRTLRLLTVVALLALAWALFRVTGLAERVSPQMLHDAFLRHKLGGLLLFTALFSVGNLVQLPGWIFLTAAVAARSSRDSSRSPADTVMSSDVSSPCSYGFASRAVRTARTSNDGGRPNTARAVPDVCRRTAAARS